VFSERTLSDLLAYSSVLSSSTALARTQDTSSKTVTPDKDRAGVKATKKAQDASEVKVEERTEEMPRKLTRTEEAELWLRWNQ